MGNMADILLHLVDPIPLRKLLSMPNTEIISAMESQTLRNLRPEPDPRFHRDFDVDIEGEILEYFDANAELEGSGTILTQDPSSSHRASVLFSRWCATSQWSCWDARLYLYVEPFLDYKIQSVDDFIRPSVWKDFSRALSKTDRLSYSESVLLDWMARRENLGESMEPSEDSRILPTMESHKALSDSLFTIMENSIKTEKQLLIGRDFLDSSEWYLGDLPVFEAMVKNYG
tara:strand:+ start:101 stop:790 length:690 start_codon:yes stop_codon:yes gene_type:complete